MSEHQDLVGLFERTMPSDDQILMPMRRAQQRRKARSLKKAPVLLWAGSALALSAVGALLLFWPQGRTPPSIRGEAESAWAKSEVHTAPDRPRTKQAEGSDSAPAKTSERATSSATSSSSSELSRRDREVLSSPPPPRQDSSRSVHSEASPAPEEQANWESVARALREGEQSKAESLLARLAQSDDAETRDNARLVKLRRQLADNEAKPNALQLAELEQLSREGATASIRNSARRLLKKYE